MSNTSFFLWLSSDTTALKIWEVLHVASCWIAQRRAWLESKSIGLWYSSAQKKIHFPFIFSQRYEKSLQLVERPKKFENKLRPFQVSPGRKTKTSGRSCVAVQEQLCASTNLQDENESKKKIGSPISRPTCWTLHLLIKTSRIGSCGYDHDHFGKDFF